MRGARTYIFGPGWRELAGRLILATLIIVGGVAALFFALEARTGAFDSSKVWILGLLSLHAAIFPPLLYSRLVRRWRDGLGSPGGRLAWFCRSDDGRTGRLELDRRGRLRFVPLTLHISFQTTSQFLWFLLLGFPGLLVGLRWRIGARGRPEELLSGQPADDAVVCPPERMLRWFLIGERPLRLFAAGEQVQLSMVGAARVCQALRSQGLPGFEGGSLP